MVYGNMPLEGNFLKLTEEEKKDIVHKYPEANRFIRPMIGGKVLVDGGNRYCLWIEDEDLAQASSIPPIKERIDGSREFRIGGGDVAKTLADRAHQFRYRKVANSSMIVTPCTTTGNRDYIPSAFFSDEYITDNSVQVVFDPPAFVFGIISSKMHMIWMQAVAGRLQDNYRYSAQLVYNTFPINPLTSDEKNQLEMLSRKVLFARENHSELTLSQLYHPNKMPEDLREAHAELDLAVDRLYRQKPYNSDEERLADLFALYEQMTNTEKETK